VVSIFLTPVKVVNSLPTALQNIEAHYDLSNDMFAAFLSEDMTYSTAIWASKSSPSSDNETLETAQLRKLHQHISGLRIKQSDHVLEIGTGRGSFAIEAVKLTGCRVTSLTLSVEQKKLAEERIATAGCQGQVTVLLCDYRALPVPAQRFDKVVSIEMAEHIGREFLETYFACVDRYLKPKGGIASIQTTTMLENVSNSIDRRIFILTPLLEI